MDSRTSEIQRITLWGALGNTVLTVAGVCSRRVGWQCCHEMTILLAHDITVRIEERLHETFGDEMVINIHIEPSEDSL